MEPTERLRMHELLKHRWLRRNIHSPPLSQAPLRTPGVLNSHSHAVQDQINCTMEAFHQATRNGFRLQEVATAPLARRRKQKKNSVDNRSSSSDSNNSTSTSNSSLSGGIVGSANSTAGFPGHASRSSAGGGDIDTNAGGNVTTTRISTSKNSSAGSTANIAGTSNTSTPAVVVSAAATAGAITVGGTGVATSLASHLPPLHASSSSSSSSQSPVRALSRNSSASSISQSSVCSLGFVPQAGMAINSGNSSASRNPSPLASLSKRSTPDEVDASSFSHISTCSGHFGSASSSNLPSHPSPLTLPATGSGSKGYTSTNSLSASSTPLRMTPLSIDPLPSASMAVIHIPSVDSQDGEEETGTYRNSSSSNIDTNSFASNSMPVKFKYKMGNRRAGGNRGRKSGSTGNTIHTSSGGSSTSSTASSSTIVSPVRLTRGRKRKLEQESLEEDGDKDCVIVERNYPTSPRMSRSAFKRLKSETIIID